MDTDKKDRLTVPPVSAAVAALKQDGGLDGVQDRGKMERTMSQGIREEREDLKEAAEQNLNVILDVGLDGLVRWVSSSWLDVVGTNPATVEGKPIAETLLEDKDAFANAVEKMKKDNSRSQRVRFSVEMGPASKLAPDPTEAALDAEDEGFRPEETMEQIHTMVLEGQGIMVYDRSSGGESHVRAPRSYIETTCLLTVHDLARRCGCSDPPRDLERSPSTFHASSSTRSASAPRCSRDT